MPRPRKKRAKSAALQYLHDRYIGNDPERLASLEEERANLDIASRFVAPDQVRGGQTGALSQA